MCVRTSHERTSPVRNTLDRVFRTFTRCIYSNQYVLQFEITYFWIITADYFFLNNLLFYVFARVLCRIISVSLEAANLFEQEGIRGTV